MYHILFVLPTRVTAPAACRWYRYRIFRCPNARSAPGALAGTVGNLNGTHTRPTVVSLLIFYFRSLVAATGNDLHRTMQCTFLLCSGSSAVTGTFTRTAFPSNRSPGRARHSRVVKRDRSPSLSDIQVIRMWGASNPEIDLRLLQKMRTVRGRRLTATMHATGVL